MFSPFIALVAKKRQWISIGISKCFSSCCRFSKMDPKDPPRLGDLAVQSLLNNEPVVIRALRVIPRDLLVPLFNAAFKGGHKNTIMAVVKIWPFHCLHIGPLHILNQHLEILKAMIECLQILPIQNPDSW